MPKHILDEVVSKSHTNFGDKRDSQLIEHSSLFM